MNITATSIGLQCPPGTVNPLGLGTTEPETKPEVVFRLAIENLIQFVKDWNRENEDKVTANQDGSLKREGFECVIIKSPSKPEKHARSQNVVDTVKVVYQKSLGSERPIDSKAELASYLSGKKTIDELHYSLLENPEFMLDLLNSKGDALAHAPMKIRADERMVLAAVRQNGMSLQYATAKLRDHPQIALAAVSQNQGAYEFIGDHLKQTQNQDILHIVQPMAYLPAFDKQEIVGRCQHLSENFTVGLFKAEQLHKDGQTLPQTVGELLTKLRGGGQHGVFFIQEKSNNLEAGTCSAMSLTFAKNLPSFLGTPSLENLQKDLGQLSLVDSRCATQGSSDIRDLQMAFNGIRVKRDVGEGIDISRNKIASLASICDFSVGNCSESISITAGTETCTANLIKEVEKMPEGLHLLRALNQAETTYLHEKRENFGHSMVFFKGKDFIGLYDPSVGMKITDPKNLAAFAKDSLLFSLKRYPLQTARFYQLQPDEKPKSFFAFLGL
ncbi:MAG: DUF4116 domain-containing protein [Chlamydiae bacterium]|nr:DUF4116 domain-containing protein [Chlamydiota bacterium]